MLLTDAQLREVRQIIADRHSSFVANAISPKALPPDTLEALKRRGLISPTGQTVADAYLYGQVLAALNDPKAEKMSLPEFRRYVQRNPVALSAPERQAVTMAQQRAAQYVVGLGNTINTKTGAILIDADAEVRRQARDTIRTKVAESIDRRQTAKQLRSELGHATQDWGRDLDRVAVTEQHNVMQTGIADNYASEARGKPVRVAKRAFPSCCPECSALFTGPDGNPRIFDLRELEANGTNVGRRRSEWKPVVGSVHPNCCCAIVRVPAGFAYDKDGVLAPADGTAKSGLRGRQNLVALAKASGGQQIAAEYAAPGSLTGRRQPRIDAADGSNFVVSSPVRAGKNRKQPPDDAPLSARSLLEGSDEVVIRPKVDRSDLPPDDSQEVQVNELVIPEEAYDDEGRAGAAEATKHAIVEYARQRAIPPNKAVTDGRTPVLQSGVREPVRRGRNPR